MSRHTFISYFITYTSLTEEEAIDLWNSLDGKQVEAINELIMGMEDKN